MGGTMTHRAGWGGGGVGASTDRQMDGQGMLACVVYKKIKGILPVPFQCWTSKGCTKKNLDQHFFFFCVSIFFSFFLQFPCLLYGGSKCVWKCFIVEVFWYFWLF